jgi:hypothetical protein
MQGAASHRASRGFHAADYVDIALRECRPRYQVFHCPVFAAIVDNADGVWNPCQNVLDAIQQFSDIRPLIQDGEQDANTGLKCGGRSAHDWYF